MMTMMMKIQSSRLWCWYCWFNQWAFLLKNMSYVLGSSIWFLLLTPLPPIWFWFLNWDFSYLLNISWIFLDICTVLPDFMFGLRPPHFPLHLPTWSGFRESGISNLGFGPKWNYLSSGPLHNGRLTVSIPKILLEFYGILLEYSYILEPKEFSVIKSAAKWLLHG